MTFLSQLLIRLTLRILLKEKIIGFIPLKPKHHWDLMLKMVFSHNMLYFAPRIIFMDGLSLDCNFRMLFLSFYCFHCCCCCCCFCCCWFRYFIIIVILFIYYTCSYAFFCFVALLGIIFLGYSAFLLFFFVAFEDHFMLNLISEILVLRSL